MLSIGVLALVWWWGDLAGPAWAPTNVVINEVVASSASTLVDEDGDVPDWIELWNPTDEPIDVGGYSLSDDPLDQQQWGLPSRIIEPDGFLLVFASGKDRAGSGELHTSFRLDRDGEPVLLSSPEGQLLDRFGEFAVPRDASLGRALDDPARLCLFAFPTPGARNAPECFEDDGLGAPTLSASSGFYDEPFDLSIGTGDAGGRLLYTLDGSYPDLDANPDATQIHDGSPLRIADRSDEPSRLASIRTAAPLDEAPWVRFEWPDEVAVPKATVVRARPEFGAETVATFFIGRHHQRSALPVVSLALDPSYLFDRHTGIYVPGRLYEDHRAAGGSERWALTPANYRQRGRAWERPHEGDHRRAVVFQWCEAGDGCPYARDIGVRIHGNISRSLPAKSLRLYARNDYGDPAFDHPFFGDDAPANHRRLVLRNSGNDWGLTMLLDGYVHGLVSHLEFETQAFQPTALYLNGEYWGIHNLRERYDQHYLAAVHGLEPDEVVILGTTLEPESGGADHLAQDYRQLLGALANHGPAEPGAAQRLVDEVDVASLLDYLIVQVFAANGDWPSSNVRLWRSAAIDDPATVPGVGGWRWMVFDLDHLGAGLGREGPGHATALEKDVGHATLERLWRPPEEPTDGAGIPLLTSVVLEDPRLRESFVSRFADHLNSTFRPTRTVPELDRLEAMLEQEMAHHVARWTYPASVEDWRDHVEELRRFMRERPAVQREQLVDLFGLDGTVTVRVEVDDPNAGYVRVNSLVLTAGSPGVADPRRWSGTYFAGVPVTFEAVPAYGYRFVGWEGTGSAVTDPRWRRAFEEDATVRAVFAPAR
jgi:hypothetical protein